MAKKGSILSGLLRDPSELMIPINSTSHKSSFSNSVKKCSASAITTGHETAEKWGKKSCIGFVLVSKFSHQNNFKSRNLGDRGLIGKELSLF